ncbi:MAG: PPC domain-containing protein [bacterium]|nr:PPC domain-containing protein [bacterium]
MKPQRPFLIALTVLLLTMRGSLAQAQQGERVPINYGDLVTGELTPIEQEQRYRFEASAGDVIVVAMAAEFDTRLYLLDSDNREIAGDDDTGYSRNSLVYNFTIPNDGTYTIRATSYSGGESGRYGLFLDTVDALPALEYGQELNGDADGLIGLYQMRGEDGDFVLLTVGAAGVDSGVQLIDPSGYSLAESNTASGQNARLGPVVLQQTGDYLVFAAGLGPYRLTLDEVNVAEVTLGEAVEGTFSNGGGLYYAFNGESGQILNILVNSNGVLDTRLTLLGPYGFEVASSIDLPGTVDPGITEFILDSDGRYFVVVEPQVAGMALNGQIELRVEAAQLTSLEDGPVTIELDTTKTSQNLTFNGRAGETVRLTFELVEGDSFASPYVDVSQGSIPLLNLSLRGMQRVQFDFIVTADGPVNVSLESYNAVTFNIQFERVTP